MFTRVQRPGLDTFFRDRSGAWVNDTRIFVYVIIYIQCFALTAINYETDVSLKNLVAPLSLSFSGQGSRRPGLADADSYRCYQLFCTLIVLGEGYRSAASKFALDPFEPERNENTESSFPRISDEQFSLRCA